MGNHIDVVTAKWVAQDAGIGAGVDSYFEYLVKGAILLHDEELMSMFLGESFFLLDDWAFFHQIFSKVSP